MVLAFVGRMKTDTPTGPALQEAQISFLLELALNFGRKSDCSSLYLYRCQDYDIECIRTNYNSIRYQEKKLEN